MFKALIVILNIFIIHPYKSTLLCCKCGSGQSKSNTLTVNLYPSSHPPPPPSPASSPRSVQIVFNASPCAASLTWSEYRYPEHWVSTLPDFDEGRELEMDGIVIAGGLSSRRCIRCWLYDAALLVILVQYVMICSACDSVVGSRTNYGVWIRSVSWECKKCHKQKLGQQLKSHWTRVGVLLAYLFKFHSLFLFRESLKFVNAPTAQHTAPLAVTNPPIHLACYPLRNFQWRFYFYDSYILIPHSSVQHSPPVHSSRSRIYFQSDKTITLHGAINV